MKENVLSSESLKELAENGHINDEVRGCLTQRIHELHMSRIDVANHLGVSLSTLHKWEHGPTTRCSLVMRRKLTSLLQSNSFLLDQPEDGNHQETLRFELLNDDVLAVMEKIGKGYEIFSHTPMLSERYLHLMDTAANDVLMSLIPPLVSTFKKQLDEAGENRE